MDRALAVTAHGLGRAVDDLAEDPRWRRRVRAVHELEERNARDEQRDRDRDEVERDRRADGAEEPDRSRPVDLEVASDAAGDALFFRRRRIRGLSHMDITALLRAIPCAS